MLKIRKFHLKNAGNHLKNGSLNFMQWVFLGLLVEGITENSQSNRKEKAMMILFFFEFSETINSRIT